MDRRVKYTKMVLNESLLKFVEQKPITKITVTEICRDADVNRSTYYTHFTDPFDQFTKLKVGILKELEEYTRDISASHLPAEKKHYQMLRGILQFVEQKRKVFRILLAKSGDYGLQHDIVKFLGVMVFLSEGGYPQEKESKASSTRDEYLLLFAANGCFGMFYHWLMDDNHVSADEMAIMMADFTRNIKF